MSDQKLVRILTGVLLDNPSATHVVKNDAKRVARVTYLAKYMLKRAKRKNGLYISKDANGLAICYKVMPNEKKTLAEWLDEIIVGFKVIGYARIPGILKRQSYLKEQMPKDFPYLYFWFLGVDKDTRGMDLGIAAELKERVFSDAKEWGLPIYTETSIKKNKIVYQRYGFEIFHEWKMNEKSTMWFMKKEF